MQSVIIEKIVIPTSEVLARVISNPSINISNNPDFWSILGNIGTFGALILLSLTSIISAVFWIKENVFRNYYFRYGLKPGHSREWIVSNSDIISQEFIKKELFGSKKLFLEYHGGALYCFCLINKGTTHDYIYSAELINEKGSVKDISTDRILKGMQSGSSSGYYFVNRNLPWGLSPLNGEVWFVAADDNKFINCEEPVLKIKTAAKEYKLKLTKDMYIKSLGTLPYNADIKEEPGNREVHSQVSRK